MIYSFIIYYYLLLDIEVIKEHLKDVKNKILILSGKGGVGKSTVCAQVSYALAHHFEQENKQVCALLFNFVNFERKNYFIKIMKKLLLDRCTRY